MDLRSLLFFFLTFSNAINFPLKIALAASNQFGYFTFSFSIQNIFYCLLRLRCMCCPEVSPGVPLPLHGVAFLGSLLFPSLDWRYILKEIYKLMRSVDLETDRQMEKQTGVKILFTMTYIINKPLSILFNSPHFLLSQ